MRIHFYPDAHLSFWEDKIREISRRQRRMELYNDRTYSAKSFTSFSDNASTGPCTLSISCME